MSMALHYTLIRSNLHIYLWNSSMFPSFVLFLPFSISHFVLRGVRILRLRIVVVMVGYRFIHGGVLIVLNLCGILAFISCTPYVWHIVHSMKSVIFLAHLFPTPFKPSVVILFESLLPQSFSMIIKFHVKSVLLLCLFFLTPCLLRLDALSSMPWCLRFDVTLPMSWFMSACVLMSCFQLPITTWP